MRSLHQSTAYQTTMPPLAAEPTADESRDAREWTISEMAKHYGLTLRALRFYEARGLIRPQRFGGARYYTARDRARLTLVLAAKQMGFTLSETAGMLGKSSDSEAADLPLSIDAMQSQIVFLESQRSAIDGALAQLRDRLTRMAAAQV